MAGFAEATQAVAGQTLQVFLTSTKGGDVSIGISTDSVQVARQICEIAGKSVLPLGVLYVSYKLLGKLIDSSAKNGLGGERDDQEVRDIKSGSLHVLLHCFTDERFLEVFEDYESGRMKERLQKEFSQAGIEMEGLKVEILNMDAVKKTLAAIEARKSFAKATEKDKASKANISNKGFQINTSVEHRNWLTVGELIRSIQKPISIYAEEIVKAFHEKLCKDLLGIGKCTSPDDCNQKTRPADLCSCCRNWFTELGRSHEKGKNPSWYKNCNSARWSEDHWEVAKFFMPALGDNVSIGKDAESTALFCLLNVLEWMKDTAFLGKTRVNVDLVRKLRSEVRNTWAHAPKQELTDDLKEQSFSIATEFLEHLENVFPKPENGECLKHLKELNNGVTNVLESELPSLLLKHQLLRDIKDEITSMKVEHSSVKSAIEEHGQKLQSLKDNNDEIRESIDQSGEYLWMNDRQNVKQEPTSCLPQKVPMFTAREAEIQKVISFLMEEEKATVSLHGGPGFGKTSIAVEVSHKLDEDHHIPVIFSQLSTATTIDEVIVQLCRDAGVNYEGDPKSSFILWLKNIKKKVVFVFDDIDKLLEEEKTRLFEFLRLMRKNSNEYCQIVTTSRAFYSIPELSSTFVHIGEMDDASAEQLLKQRCPDQDGEFLIKLAQLCGHMPLAMCIAASRVDDFEEPNELLQHLEKKPMKILECPESNLFVYRAINRSYEMLDDEKKEALVRLAVPEENFSEAAAKAVIEKENSDAKRILKDLVLRSLIKQPIQHRYSIHLLIRHFLNDQPQRKENRSHAKTLMIRFYLDLGHELTIKHYSKDGYKASREDLKKEAHNIQNMLTICSQQKDINSDISTALTKSKIYTISAKFFSMFVRTVIPGSIVDQFLQCCAKLAGERKELAIKLNFDCLTANQERIKSIGESDKYFKIMEKITEEFEKHYEDLKEDKSLCAHYYYQYARYLIRKFYLKQNQHNPVLVTEAREQLKKSLSLREDSTDTFEGKADVIFSLLKLGSVCRTIAKNEHHSRQKAAREESAKAAETYYEKAIELSQMYLGEHELTSACYKALGDHFLLRQNNDQARDNYTIAKEIRERLGLGASEKHVYERFRLDEGEKHVYERFRLDEGEKHVYLLNNLGKCLTYSNRTSEAIELLKEACDMAEKLAESDEPNGCKARVYTSLAIAHNLKQRYSEDAVNYAKKALEFTQIDTVIKKPQLRELQQIVSRQRWKK